ncbi:ribonuclease Y [Acidobacteria bacterium AH-259-O06]|nr:ribonuclease Y [Acidobacteria bacterium AH-259-O06]
MHINAMIAFAAVAAVVIVLWYIVEIRLAGRRVAEATMKAEEITRSAHQEAERIKKEKLVEAKDQIFDWRSEGEKEIQVRRRELNKLERRLSRKEDNLQSTEQSVLRKERDYERRVRQVQNQERSLGGKERQLEALIVEQTSQLEAVAGMTAEEAKKVLIKSIEGQALHDAAMLAKRIEDEARENAQREARKILAQAIQRCAAEHVVESTVSVVDLPSDDMKGRIIGREGRNIRALEQATGVDLIVDDTPEAVILSGFDPLRREIAKLSIELLIKDGRIHPSRIEEVVSKVEKEMGEKVREEGEQVAFELGIHSIHPDLLRLVGKLKYRTSYGQNVLFHSREVAYLAGIMARELEADVNVCKRAGLLHDVGKAVDRDMEGTHLQLGVELARKYGESPEVIHAMEAHHFDVEFRTLEAVLVQSADATSAARPGARREVLESYVKRLEKLEEIAASFPGVSRAFALQAGREVRIIVESSKVSDEQAFWLTKDITKKIENELQYPGQIKVTLIREMRVVDYAK